MRKFVFKLIIVLAGIFIIDILVGLVGVQIIKKLNEKNYTGEAALFGYKLEAVKTDILILGSSTACCHYIPSILKDSINACLHKDFDAFNAGATFQQPNYSYCVLKSVLSRKVPSIVILDIQPQQLGEKAKPAALHFLHPYYSINPNVKEVLEAHESFDNKICLKSAMYRFNVEIFKLIMSFGNSVGTDGFMPKKGKIEQYAFFQDKDSNKLNEVMADEFEETLSMAKEHNIKLFVSLSPRLYYPDRDSESFKKIVELCDKYTIPILDFTKDDDFQKGDLFFDTGHLNYEGAELLTNKTFQKIKEELIQKPF